MYILGSSTDIEMHWNLTYRYTYMMNVQISTVSW